MCKARESARTRKAGIQGKGKDPCDQGLDGHSDACLHDVDEQVREIANGEI